MSVWHAIRCLKIGTYVFNKWLPYFTHSNSEGISNETTGRLLVNFVSFYICVGETSLLFLMKNSLVIIDLAYLNSCSINGFAYKCLSSSNSNSFDRRQHNSAGKGTTSEVASGRRPFIKASIKLLNHQLIPKVPLYLSINSRNRHASMNLNRRINLH